MKIRFDPDSMNKSWYFASEIPAENPDETGEIAAKFVHNQPLIAICGIIGLKRFLHKSKTSMYSFLLDFITIEQCNQP